MRIAWHLRDVLRGLLLAFLTASPVLTTSASSCEYRTLVHTAAEVLVSNWDAELGGTPAARGAARMLDTTASLLAAYANARHQPERARTEFLTLTGSQWPNGMLPKHIYAQSLSDTRWIEGELVPGPPAWNVTGVSVPATSGLAALPLFSIVAERIFDETYHSDPHHAVSFVESVFDSLYKYHDYLHTERAIDGRVLLYHPWESELPTTSPVFSQLMREVRASGGLSNWTAGVYGAFPPQQAALSEFPGNSTYHSELELVACLVEHRYESAEIERHCPFLLQDVEFSSVLQAADEALWRVAKLIQNFGSTKKAQATESRVQTIKGWADQNPVKDMWSQAWQTYLSEFTVGQQAGGGSELSPVDAEVVGNLAALYGGTLPASQRDALAFSMMSPGGSGSFQCGSYPVPACGCAECPAYDGGVWMVHNHFLERGLRQNEALSVADWVRNASINLVCNRSMLEEPTVRSGGPWGFHRAFDQVTGAPLSDEYGNTSTAAAAVFLLTMRQDATDPSKPHAPVGHSVVLALMIVELALAFAVGVGCLVTSILMMRKLRREREAPLFFPRPERQPSVASPRPSTQRQQEQHHRLLSDDPGALDNQASAERILMPDSGEQPIGVIGHVASVLTRIPGLRWLQHHQQEPPT